MADKVMFQMVDQLRKGREWAITHRRAVEVRFPDSTTIQLVQRDIPEGETVLSSVEMTNRFQFYQFGGLPDTPDAYRYENGQLMAGPGCIFLQGCDNMKKQRIPTLAGITWRIMAVDEEMGIVAVRMNFGPGSTFDNKGVLDVWHSFKIYGGQIHAAEAYCEIVPAGTKSGWE
jgi:hypothetical protein